MQVFVYYFTAQVALCAEVDRDSGSRLAFRFFRREIKFFCESQPDLHLGPVWVIIRLMNAILLAALLAKQSTVQVTVDASQITSISKYIYGVNFPDWKTMNHSWTKACDWSS